MTRTEERCAYCWGPVGEVRISRIGRLYCCQEHAYRGPKTQHLRLVPSPSGQLSIDDELDTAA